MKRAGKRKAADFGQAPVEEGPADNLARRDVLKLGVVLGGALLLGGGSARADAPATPRAQTPSPLRFRGVNYDTGTNYDASFVPVTRTVWERGLLERDMRAVREGLHCNAVTLYGTDVARLAEAAAVALGHDLNVWLQPRLMEAGERERLEHLEETAREAERLRRRYGNVTLNVGVELSLYMAGIIPGNTFWERMAVLGDPTKRDIPAYTRKLDAHLEAASSVARGSFSGPLTYSAGEWERISWTPFDIVGLSFYMSALNRATYAETLRQIQASVRASGKPVVITEFGCCTFEGAGDMGANGWSIVDYSQGVPQIPAGYVRSEQEQADYLVRLLEIYRAERLDGAFVYDFSAPLSPYSSNPRYDLDMASFAVVKSILGENELEATRWRPKRAFRAVGRFYGGLEDGRSSSL